VSSDRNTVSADDRSLLATRELTTCIRTDTGLLRAVDGVSIELRACEALGVVGESGSGKSMLARSILDILPAQAVRPRGEVLLEGQDLRQLSKSQMRSVLGRRIGMVFQDPMTSLNPVMRVERQLTEAIRAGSKTSRSERPERALELLRLVGIPEPERRLSAFPHQLSGGMRQRVGIAAALAGSPSLLIADEPTTALDVTIQGQILDLLRDLQRQNGMGLMLITHDLGVVAGRTDRVIVMYAGQVVEATSTRELFRSPQHPYTVALLEAMPKLRQTKKGRLRAIPGSPPRVVDPKPGCRFAPRCARAQDRCTGETPSLKSHGAAGHLVRCFYPAGTGEGAAALAQNVAAGRTAAGLAVDKSSGVA
jgi:peptide/nickel transport system ATP-binding protein